MKKIIFLLLLAAAGQSFLKAQSPTVQTVINQTNLDSLIYFVKELSGEVTTNIGGAPYTILSRQKDQPGNNKAADYIKQKLSSYGLQTFDHYFGTSGRNIIGIQTGTLFPDSKYIICAHYDDMPTGSVAPGADDNASGSAAVIEAARLFSKYNSKYTIIFAFFDEEEYGLLGSNSYAALTASETILGVINLDMISWDNDLDNRAEIHIQNIGNSVALKDKMVLINSTYSIGLIPVIQNPGTTASDHAPFWNYGRGALLLIEEYYGNDFNAYYHTVNDKLIYFNQPYYHKMSKLALGTVAALAELEPAAFQLTVNVNSGWNMVSIPGLHPANQNVTTWWPGKDPSSGVFRFNAGYEVVTTAVPGRGYWMKHVGANTYNTGDEWPSGGILIVPHDPIPIVPGWNMIGVYDCAVSASGLTTTPPGLINGFVYQYSGGYQTVSILNPGYGYWVFSSGTGFLNIPDCSAEDNFITKNEISGYRKIIFTEKTMQNHTLYILPADETDLTRFSLPPLPPSGMPDVRFSSQRNTEKLSSIPQGIEMTGMQYPVKIKAEGEGIVLFDESGREIVRLQDGEEIYIYQETVRMYIAENSVPLVYSLGQNYPNPFNPVTTIQFSIPEDVNNLKLIIYNSLGEKTAELVNSSLKAGNYEYKWDASIASSGLYIYQIISEKFISSKKMMLMK